MWMNSLRFLMPLVISDDELDEGLDVMTSRRSAAASAVVSP
jgi:4-aminobutyrate aminotransferase-like enzyme